MFVDRIREMVSFELGKEIKKIGFWKIGNWIFRNVTRFDKGSYTCYAVVFLSVKVYVSTSNVSYVSTTLIFVFSVVIFIFYSGQNHLTKKKKL